MDKLRYYEVEKQKCQSFISNIYMLIEQIDMKINDLKRIKRKTDIISNKFEINNCYNYNLVKEMIESRNKLYTNINKISKESILQKRESDNIDTKIKNINQLRDLLDKTFTELKDISRKDVSEIENLQMNVIKKEIYDKFKLLKSDIDRAKIKKSFDKIQNRSIFMKAFDSFFEREEDVDRKKENLFFAIHEIDNARSQIINKKIPDREYKIIDILAEIELYLNENRNERQYKEKIKSIRKIRRNIYDTFSVDKSKLKYEMKKIESTKLPIKINKRMNKTLKEKQKIIAFLTKNGYYQNAIKPNIKSNLQNIIEKLDIVSTSLENENKNNI